MKEKDGYHKNTLQFNILSQSRDEIYGISTIWIMLFHGCLSKVVYFKDIPVAEYFGEFLSRGNLGVEVFLFLSGICLYFSFVKNSSIIAFMKKRLARIYKPVWIIGGIYCLYLLLRSEISLQGLLFRIMALSFWINGDTKIWFVSVILVCYFLYPYLYHFIFDKEKGEIRRTVILTAVFILMSILIMLNAPKVYDSVEIGLTRFVVFIIGCLMGKFVYEKKEISSKWWLVFVLMTVLYFVALHMRLIPKTYHNIYKRYWGLIGGIPISFLFAKLVEYLPKCVRKCLGLFGHMSLELYLAHIILQGAYRENRLFTYVPGSIARYLLVLLISIIIAFITLQVENLLKKGYLHYVTKRE
jgi:peptidoglycan/LPS O-acetylase OafA/YrhL